MILVVLLICMTIFYWSRYKNWTCPACLMSGLWAIILLVYKLNPVPLNVVSERTYHDVRRS